jgi:hypothetical protein
MKPNRLKILKSIKVKVLELERILAGIIIVQ